ncbi:Asp-tRNA(Asn)/Glu-tRNA(Gln) amidotransferase subunit GatA [Thermosulfurimonas sp. F29]|uniref:Asp-tRNA(Asn)/Glu-tRNA(Gln) amidotransferase subunit GatA n=1 Tax=Thermosulfurimonas sp. F29 TaxID=2867247 RepID=UPI001C83105E|nr:Asp-tRNA(Asn)/Glu-tRNA(Gln) amidotransferase subunit GatA [Thermosulfurimonas sp. F29]MBX6422296.1 Asp-tRNA(Asn)/Glu-tRNA(Gln) amidotransferase subunit GatA [Thermosulfurimonas sp. F29]
MERSSLLEWRERLRRGELSARELVDHFLSRIERLDGRIRAYITVTAEEARRAAEEADRRRASGEDLPLLGIPLAVKDNICTRGVRTTCASRILEDFVPPYDATVVERLKAAGAIILGKTNLDEFAMGSSTENSAFFPTRNPWDLERVPGGSSGGSAAAVAADLCAGALGSDTGGSIRQPASFCGVVGFKPTYGRVSRYGLVAFASSLDQIGPLTKTVADAALLLQVTGGPDGRDSTCWPEPQPDYLGALTESPREMTLGLPREAFGEGLSEEVRRVIEEAVRAAESLGCRVREISLPHLEYALPAYYIIAPAEASSNLARYDGVKYGFRAEAGGLIEMYKKTRSQGFGPEVKRRIMLGTYALSAGYYEAFYRKASQVRTLIMRDFEEAFRGVDLILMPASPTPAFRLGEKTDDPLKMYLSDIYTIPVNLAGLPGLSLPVGFTGERLPVGLQIIGPQLADARVLSFGHALERALALDLTPPLE